MSNPTPPTEGKPRHSPEAVAQARDALERWRVRKDLEPTPSLNPRISTDGLKGVELPKLSPQPNNGNVYLMRCTESGNTKIGFAKSVARRFKEIQAHSPTKLEVIHTVSAHHHHERQLHAQFADRRLHGEWFDLTDEDIAWIQKWVPRPIVYGDHHEIRLVRAKR